MKLSLIINTACMDPLVAHKTQLYANMPYGGRRALLHDEILPAAKVEEWDEIFVVGSFEPGKGYTYLPMQPIYRDRRDALWQRELGARHSMGDILGFSHDDHMFSPGVCTVLRNTDLGNWDLLVPTRVDKAGGSLDNGQARDYMGGHALIMRRKLWAQVPWTAVDTEWWDVSLTRIWRAEGGIIKWTNELQHVDLDTAAPAQPTLLPG